jgi:DNA uptake protein ComE-like DNA-binding protein
MPDLIRHPVLFWIPAPRFRGDKLRGNDDFNICYYRSNHIIQGGAAMSKKAWIEVLATVVALIFTAASGWAADPKTAVKPTPVPQQKVEKKAEKIDELVDLNTATKAQLMALTGIGELTVQRIIKNRPYAKKDQLKSMKILTAQEYDRIKDRIIARQNPKKN